MIYLAGIIITFANMLVQALWTLDKYDYKECKFEILGYAFLLPILWLPALAFNPKLFFRPYKELSQQQDHKRKWNQILSLPVPKCGRLVKYLQYGYENGKELQSTFTFQAADIEDYLGTLISEHPHLEASFRGDILKWVMTRDDSDIVPVCVPERWFGMGLFDLIANQLLKSRTVKIECHLCNSEFESGEANFREFWPEKGGWNSEDHFCPKGHLLLNVQTVHSYVGPEDDDFSGLEL